MENKVKVGKTIERLRKERQLSQEDLAYLSNLSLQYISDLERDKYYPSINAFFKIAVVFDISPSELMIELEKTTDLLLVYPPRIRD